MSKFDIAGGLSQFHKGGIHSNPDVIPRPANATFQTRCNIPQRSGRHVIYAEWGRNQFTFERFHGCIDAVFEGGTAPRLDARIAFDPNVTEFECSGSITLDGRVPPVRI